jgi:hypothetical protein
VKGHTDLIDHPLTQDERLNIEAYLQADIIRAQARGPLMARPMCTHWDIEEASLSIYGHKVTSDMNAPLITHIYGGNLDEFLMEKES